MSDQLPDTWSWRDLPVLRAAVAGVDEKPVIGIELGEIVRQTGLTLDDVYRSTKALEGARLISLRETMGRADTNRVSDVAGAARVHAGQWPSEETALDRMIAALQAIAEDDHQPEDKRSRARKVLDGLGGAGRDLGVAVAAAMITGQIPGAGS